MAPMKLKDMSIRTRIKIGIGLILALTTLLAILAWHQTNQLWLQTTALYERPLEVRRAIGHLRADILVIHWAMEELFAHEDFRNMARVLPLITAHEANARAQFEVLFDRYSGDRADVDALHQAVEECRANREEVLRLLQAGDADRARVVNIHDQTGPDTRHLQEVMGLLQKVDDVSRSFGEQFFQSAAEHHRTMSRQLILAVAAIILLTALAGYLVYAWISAPLKELITLARQFRQGNYDARSRSVAANEFGTLASAFNQMAEAIAFQMTLRGINEQLSATLLGANDLPGFRQALLTRLVDVTDSQMGTYFLHNPAKGVYEPVFSLGMDHDRLQAFDAETLEGQLGKTLTTRKTTVLRDIPEDAVFRHRTFAGSIQPREMISFPVVVDGEVRAVISLASIRPYSAQALELLNLPWATLVHTVFANLTASDRTRRLSLELQESNQELHAQQGELQSQAEELLRQTEELQAQNVELQRQRQAVEEATRLKSQFLSNMSHELRTPLNSVLALSRVLLMQARTKLSPDEASYLEIIERNGKNLLALINDILDLSKVEAGRMDLAPKPFALGQTLDNILQSVAPLARDKQIELRRDIPADLPEVESDELRVTQIMQNLLGNAVKFTDAGHVSVSVHTGQDQVLVRVADTGIGIAKKDLPHVFDEFRQVDGSAARRHEGTGLGLTIARKTARMLGGDVTVQSAPGQGSVFTLALPLTWQGRNQVSKPLVLTPPSGPKPEQKTILVVDDEPQIAAMIAGCLEQEGYNTIIAASGAQALQIAARQRPFAMTLDILMPDMDGWEVLQALKSNPDTRDIHVIVVSVSQDRETGFALGAVGAVAKPVSRERLVAEIRRLAEPRTGTVMIVDDNDLDRQEVRRIVEEAGFTPVVAETGAACLDLLKQQVPDVLVLDLVMPAPDGFGVLEQIRSAPKTRNLPVIVVTAKDLSAADRRRLSGNISSVLTKNAASSPSLLKEIKTILNNLQTLPPGADARPDRPRILLVEDNEAAIIQVSSALESAGYTLDVARGGQEAIASVGQNIPDGIILDLMMPQVDGFAVLERIRGTQATANIPVLVLTAKDLTPEDLSRLSANCIQQLVQKGDVDRENLLAKVRAMVEARMPAAGAWELEGGDADHVGKGRGVCPAPQGASSRDRATSRASRTSPPRDDHPPTILIVEDNPDNMTTIKAILQDRCRTLEAADGEAGLRLAAEHRPDLILLDMALPGMDGLAVLRQLKEDQALRSIPVIAMTARAMKGEREEILAAGCDDYIAKPVDPTSCLETIQTWLQP